jgi:hypothetical protein
MDTYIWKCLELPEGWKIDTIVELPEYFLVTIRETTTGGSKELKVQINIVMSMEVYDADDNRLQNMHDTKQER